jgi:hypothetical protein
MSLFGRNSSVMAQDSDYFRRRAAEVRSSAFHKGDGESAEVAGNLALAFAALAKRREAATPPAKPDASPLMLRD